MLLKRSRAAEPESLLLNGSFRSCQHSREVREQPLQDDEVQLGGRRLRATSPSEIQGQPWDVVSKCGGVAVAGSPIGAPMKPTLLSAKAEAM